MLATSNTWNSGSRERETNCPLREARYSDGSPRDGCGWLFAFSFILGLPRSGIGVWNCIYQLWCRGSFLSVNIIAPVALSAGAEIQTVP